MRGGVLTVTVGNPHHLDPPMVPSGTGTERATPSQT